MADIAKIKRNIQRMIDQNAPESDIDAYVASEGVTPEILRGESSLSEEPEQGRGGFWETVEGFTPMGMAKDAYRAVTDPMGALQTLDDTARLAASGLSFGYADKFAAKMNEMTGLDERNLSDLVANSSPLERERSRTQAARDRQGVRGAAVEIGAGVLPAVKAAQLGLTATRLPGMAGKLGGAAIDGAALGGLTAAGNDQNIGVGIGTGLAGGALGQAVTSGVGALARPFVSRFSPDRGAARIMGNALDDAGMQPWQVADDLTRAQADDQGSYAVMDAMGNPGQRLASTVARSPGPGRTAMVDALEKRQAGQGRRVASYLSEGFDDPATALQRVEALKKARKEGGDINYGNARGDAGLVNTSSVLAKIDDMIGGPAQPFDKSGDAAGDTVAGALRRVRSMLAGDDGAQVIDFERLLRARSDIGDMANVAFRGGKNKQGAAIKSVLQELDAVLADASPSYRKALEQYAKDSATIGAVDKGRTAAQRGRYEDTIPAFQNLSPEEQAAFRAGYADPLIAQTQGAAVGVNKVRPLINDAFEAEFPAIAAPGRGDQLGRRLRREQTMFETRNAAMGGSKTADNLADEAAMSAYDPSIIGNVLTGNFMAAGKNAVVRALTTMRGETPAVRERIAKILTENNPAQARELLEKNAAFMRQSKATRDAIVRALMLGSVAGTASAQR